MNRCPSQDQLERLLDERLAESEQDQLSIHIADCLRCQAQLECLTEDPGELTPARTTRRLPLEDTQGLLEPPAEFLEQLKNSPPRTGGPVFAPARRGLTAPAAISELPSGADIPLVPGYEILSELGRGGMGIVYKARHLDLNRIVALKMIRAGNQSEPKDRIRFRSEAAAVARLHHPHIVQIFDIAECDGRPFFALEFVGGGSLSQRLRGDPQPVLAAARVVETLARAIHFAHQHGVVHRDLKPANILLESGEWRSSGPRTGEQPPLAQCVPKITDFGLAKRLDEEASVLQTGEVVGTPSYMSPEQAGGKVHQIGPPADVYALGAVLYEMLTGRPPFKGAASLDTILQVIHEEPIRPSHLRPKLPRDLETICLKCLDKDPGRRYASADALAEDLHRFRQGKPIQARPITVRERAWKWARRHPISAALLAGILLVTVCGFAGITWQWRETAQARDVALMEKREKEQQRLQAERARADTEAARQQEAEQRKKTRLALYYNRIAQSELQWRLNDFPGAEQSLAQCLPVDSQSDRRGWEWYHLKGRYHQYLFTFKHACEGQSGGVAVRPDGQWIASVIGGHPPEEVGKAAELRIWDSRSGEVIHAASLPPAFHRLAFSADGKRLVLAANDGGVRVWDALERKELLRATPHALTVSGVAFSPDGRSIATASADRTAKIWDARTGEVAQTLRGHGGWLHSIAYHPSGERLATGSDDATVRIWDARTGAELQVLRGHKSAIYNLAFSPNGQYLVSAGSNGNIKIWDLATGRTTQSLTANAGAVLGIAFSPDGRYLAHSGGDTTVRVWDIESGVERINYRGHTAPVDAVQFTPDGQRLVSVSSVQAAVKVWDLTRHPEYATFARTNQDIEALGYRADGQQLVSLTIGGKLQTWDATSGLLLSERTLPVTQDAIGPSLFSAFSPDGRRLATRCGDDRRSVKVWDLTANAEVATVQDPEFPIACLRFSADGHWLVTCACSPRGLKCKHEVRVWKTATGEPVTGFHGRGHVFNLACSPDGKLISLAGEGGQVWIVELASRRTIFNGTGHRGDVATLAFSPKGGQLASAGLDDRCVNIWEAAAGEWRPLFALAAPPYLGDLAFSPDGRRLAGISRDVVKLWDTEIGQEVLTLRGAPQRHFDPPFNPRIAFSPDGQRLAGTNWDESFSVWEAEQSTNPAEFALRQAARQKSADDRAVFWDLQEAEQCLVRRDLPAAAVHLKRLANAKLPEPLQHRKTRVEIQLDKLLNEKPRD